MRKFPEDVPTAILGKILGVTPRQLQRLVAAGILTQTGYGTFNLASAVQSFIRHKSKRDHDASDYGVARTKLVEEKAEAAKSARLEREGKVMRVAVVQDMWGKIFVTIRTNFMRLPVMAAPRLVNLKSPMEVQRALDPMVREILEELPPELEIIVNRYAA